MKTQNKQILHYLSKGKSLTPLDALRRFDCLRLAARIYDLRSAGHDIDNFLYTTKNGKRVSKYRLSR